MQAADGNADDGRNGRCQRRAGQAPAHGEDEDIVKHHIEQAAAQGGHHGQRGVAVVPGKGRNDVVAHEERREQQEDAGILQAQRHNGCIAAHQPEHRIRTERPYQHKRHCNQDRAHQAVGKIAVGPLIVLRLEDSIAGGRAQADHGAKRKNKIINGQAEVEHRHAVGAGGLRNKIGIGQNVAGRADQPEDVLRDIFKVLLGDVHRISFLRDNKKRTPDAPSAQRPTEGTHRVLLLSTRRCLCPAVAAAVQIRGILSQFLSFCQAVFRILSDGFTQTPRWVYTVSRFVFQKPGTTRKEESHGSKAYHLLPG